ncbi:MAG: hypothetical protein ACFB22_06565 [Rhodothalassiaceae bacterium]
MIRPLMLACLTLMPAALADVGADEQQLLQACVGEGNDQERCRCYLGVIRSEAGADRYERAVGLAVAGLSQDPQQVVETMRRFNMTQQDMQILARALEMASQRAAEVCEPAQ